MSIEGMPLDNLEAFSAAPSHPAAPGGYSPYVQIDRTAQQLQAFREASGLSQNQIARNLGWSASKVARIEYGQARPSGTDARALLEAYAVTDEGVIGAIIEAARANRRAILTNSFTPILTPVQQHYLGYEGVAVGMDIYAPFLVPDTFQTSAYRAAKDRIFYPARSADEHELAARLLRERASRLIGKHGPHMRIVVEERALRTPEARSDPSGEHDQYAQLRLIIDGLKRLNTARQELPPGSELNPNITIQVEPLTSGTHPLCRCAHTLLHMSNRPHAAVYVQNPAGRYETFYPNPAEHTIEQQTFSRLLDMLPGPEKTDEILDNILASFPS